MCVFRLPFFALMNIYNGVSFIFACSCYGVFQKFGFVMSKGRYVYYHIFVSVNVLTWEPIYINLNFIFALDYIHNI